MKPVICLGQQPNGILPKRFFIAKLETARRIQDEIGGEIVWFLHDSDHDYRETRTRIKSDQHPEGYVDFNFDFRNKIVRKWSPLARKEFDAGAMEEVKNGLHHLTNEKTVNIFEKVNSLGLKYASEFCVKMYEEMGIIEGIKVISSFSPEFRRNAAVEDFGDDYFYDADYEGELVRAEVHDSTLRLHHGGKKYTTIQENIDLGELKNDKEKISAGRDKRFGWMQSAVKCTHYVMGNSEAKYLDQENIDGIELMQRDHIDDPGMSWWPES